MKSMVCSPPPMGSEWDHWKYPARLCVGIWCDIATTFIPVGGTEIQGAKCIVRGVSWLIKVLRDERGALSFTGKATQHGAVRLEEGAFDDVAVATLKASGRVYEQADGAKVYVQQVGPDAFDYIIESADGAIVTAHRGATKADLDGLAKSYGWSGYD